MLLLLLRRSGTKSSIPVGSSVEGGMLCRSYSSDPDCDVVDLDVLRVLDNHCFTDNGSMFGPAPDHPGWYWVNKDVMCPRLANIAGYVDTFNATNSWSNRSFSIFGWKLYVKCCMTRFVGQL